MVDMYFDADSPENIDVREYSYPTTAHGYDAYNSPFVYHKPLSSGMCPTEDFCELFDGFERYPDGSIRVTDGNSNATGHYIMYDEPMDIFKNVEPRLRANIIYPGDYFKDRNQELRTGTYVGSTPISPLFSDYSYSTSDKTYQQLDAYTKKPKTLYLSPNPNSSQEQVPLEDGTTMNASGANGPFYANGEGSLTGLLVRKYLNPDPSAEIGEGKCDQHFILMRYGEVLLNMAEAAIELSIAGVASPDGDNLLQQATEAVNKIRSRAGATLLTGTLDNTNVGRNIFFRFLL
jgi:hypothetical protein